MKWNESKKALSKAKDWIIHNQKEDGRIVWDKKGKCDPWDHCECLIALALYEEWDSFNLGVDWFFNNLNEDGLIHPEFKNITVTHKHFESHHAPYIILPLMQAVLMGRDDLITPNIKSKINIRRKLPTKLQTSKRNYDYTTSMPPIKNTSLRSLVSTAAGGTRKRIKKKQRKVRKSKNSEEK